MSPFRKTVRLPVVFRALDLEQHTKPQGTVMCPVRNEPVTLGTCGHCADFIRVEFDAHSKPHVGCSPRPHHVQRVAAPDQPNTIQALLRVPMLSVSQDTPLAAMTPYVELQRPWEIIPVLDDTARPVGIISNAALRQELAEQGDASRLFRAVMTTSFCRAYPWQSLNDAASARSDAGFRGVVVVSAQDTFLGLVPESDLPDAA